jgi:hypothetical protein
VAASWWLEFFEAWKRWYLQEYGRVDPSPASAALARAVWVSWLFSAPEDVQTEVEVAAVEPAAAAAAERNVRRLARSEAELVALALEDLGG